MAANLSSTTSTATFGLARPSFSPQQDDTSSLASIETPQTSVESSPYGDYMVTQAQPSRDSCDRRRPTEKDSLRLVEMPQRLVGQTVTPFLREHIPEMYAPIGKPESLTMEITPNRDQNSKFCYRHRPDSKCRRAADENKMSMIQRQLDTLPLADRQGITHVWSLFSAAPSKHRELMLQGIITQCCFPQLSAMSREIGSCLKIDFMSALPPEISFKILCYLDSASLCRAAQVSRRWRSLADDDVVWHTICSQHIDRKCTKCGWGLPRMEKKRLKDWKKQNRPVESSANGESTDLEPVIKATPADGATNKRALTDADHPEPKRLRGDGEIVEPLSPVEEVPKQHRTAWKYVYRDRFEVGRNWKHGRCSIKIFKGHSNGVTCLQFDDKIMATGSYDSTVKIWDIQTGKELRTLRGHTMGIRALQIDGNRLVTGSLDHTIRIWNWQTGAALSTLQFHTEGVITVHSAGKWLASGSIDRTIKLTNFETKETWCLRAHDDCVNHVRMDLESRTLLSASDDCTFKLWDMDTKTVIRTFEGHAGQVQQVLPLPDDFEPDEVELADHKDSDSVSSGRGGSPAGSTCGANASSQASDRAAYGPLFEDDPSRPLPCRYIMTAGLDNTIRLWDTVTGKSIRTMFGHVEGIWSLVGDTLRVVSGANDHVVKIWEPRSGKCERSFVGHSGPVTCVGLSDDQMASGSEDGEVRLYTFDDHPTLLQERGTPS